MRLLGSNYSVVNLVGPNNGGITGLSAVTEGNSNDGRLLQYNDGKRQTPEPFTGFGSKYTVIAADPGDTFTLQGGWRKDSEKTETDDQTGIAGVLYKHPDGSHVLISGDAEVKLEGGKTPPTPNPGASAISVKPTKDDITGDIREIELALQKQNPSHGNPDGVLLKSEVEKISTLHLPGVDKSFWLGIYQNWHNYDNETVKLGKKSTKGSDNVLIVDDIVANLSYQG